MQSPGRSRGNPSADAPRNQAAGVRAAVVQIAPSTDLADNLKRAAALIAEAAAAGATLIGLPEVFTIEYRKDLFASVAEPIVGTPSEGAATTGSELMAACARTHSVTIFGGVVERDGDRLFNSVAVYNPSGGLQAVYRKLHLSCVRAGEDRTSEADVFNAGRSKVSFAVRSGVTDKGVDNAWRVGIGICFDLRFDLHRAYARDEAAPCDILAYPSAFLASTGIEHWELLLRARALDEQVFVLAPNHGQNSTQVTKMFGHAMICGPWGRVLASTGCCEGDKIAIADLAREVLVDTRARIPLKTVRAARALNDGADGPEDVLGSREKRQRVAAAESEKVSSNGM